MNAELKLHHLVVHELQKQAEQTEVQLVLSESLATEEEHAHSLIDHLDQTFESKSDILQGYLSPPEDALFPGYFQHWVEQGMMEDRYLEFTRQSMEALQNHLTGVIGAKGGYLVFADYSREGHRMLGIYLVRDTEGLIFRQQTDQAGFSLEAVTYLNINRLAMACRIQLDRLQDGGRNVQFIKHARSQANISQYFTDWVGLERPQTSRVLTDTFLEVVENLPLPTDQETGQAMTESQFQEEVRNFALRSPQQTIELSSFDNTFYGTQPTLQTYIEENEVELDNSFRIDNNTLRRHNQLRASAGGINISFSREHLASGEVSIEGGRIVINAMHLVEKIEDLL